MKTITFQPSGIKYVYLVFILVTLQLGAQTSVQTQAQIKKLNKESDELTVKADDLRERAEKVDGEIKKMMLDEAANFELEATKKRYAAAKMTYDEKRKVAVINDTKIQQARSANTAKSMKAHTQFLVDDYHKNMKTADELYREAMAGKNINFQLGSLENALEKLTLSLQQQLDVLLMIQEETLNKNMASTK